MLNPDYRDIFSAFGAAKVEYLLVGAYAMAVHGLPRATGDIDLWIRRSPENATRVISALHAFGAPLEQISADDFQQQDLVFQIGVVPQRIDLLTSLTPGYFGGLIDRVPPLPGLARARAATRTSAWAANPPIGTLRLSGVRVKRLNDSRTRPRLE